LESGTFWLSPTPEKPSLGWGAHYHRICTWARLKDLSTGKTLQFWNTHFDHESLEARRKSAELLLERTRAVRAGKEAFVLVGDFNDIPGSDFYRILSSALRDSLGISETPAYGPQGTFNGFRYAGPLEGRIDHVFVGEGLQVLRHGTLTDSYGQHFPSDHFPVLTELRLP